MSHCSWRRWNSYFGKQRKRSATGSPPDRRRQPTLEKLESRELLAASIAQPTSEIFHPSGIGPFAGPGAGSMTPTQIRHAYGFDQLSFGGTPADGRGTTIAIIDAFDDPNISSDLAQFDAQFGLAATPSFKKVNQSGGSSLPSSNASWGVEISLDVEWAHAIAPMANILLVEANSSSLNDLTAAAAFAASQPNVVAVSMSFGGNEFSGESSFDSSFTTPAGHTGVTFLASSGDTGAVVEYPAASPNVISVGGTTLQVDSSGNLTGTGETGWSGSGGGISSQEAQPAYQHGVVTQSTTNRANPDVSYDADPNTGFPVFDTFGTGTTWETVGGTSDASPQWAALIAIADEGRNLAGESPLNGASQTLPMLYSMPSNAFRDITSGTTSSGTNHFSAGTGYDLITGRGSPMAATLVPDLVGVVSPTQVTHFVVTAQASTTAGNSFTVTVVAANSSGTAVAGYLGTVNLSSSDPSASIVPSSYQFTATDAGSHSFTVTLDRAGSQTINVVDAANSSVTGSATVSVSAAAASKLSFTQQPGSVVAGVTISPAVVVQVLDKFNNPVTSDNTDQVTIVIGTNPAGGVLSGTTTVTVHNGAATFSNLSINAPGTGYTLTASAPGLGSVPSASFNVTTTPAANLIEGFETSDNWFIAGGRSITGFLSSAAAHDGSLGFDDTNGNDWIYRTDTAAQVKSGDQVSVWLQFANSADGRAYFAFGASSGGTYALVAAPNTGQLIIQSVPGFSNFINVAATNQSFLANHWYRLEVDLGTNGTVAGKLFDSNGTTLLGQVVATGLGNIAGGIGFRAIGSDKYWDTVTDARGVVGGLSSSGSPLTKPGSIGTTGSSSSPAAQSKSGSTTSSGTGVGFAAIDAFFLQLSSHTTQQTSYAVAFGLPFLEAEEWRLPF